MCKFITAVLPADADVVALDALMRRFDRRLLAMADSGIRSHLRKNERYFLTTLGHCDCDTALGIDAPDDGAVAVESAPGDPGARWTKAADRLRRKGWSESKIARSLAPQIESEARVRERFAQTYRTDAERWRDCLQAVLASGATDRIALLVREYCGALDCVVDVRGRETIRSAAISPEVLMAMRADVLHEFLR